VEHVARLAHGIDRRGKELFTSQLDGILAYVDKLDELNTDGIIPTSHAVPMKRLSGGSGYPSIGLDNALANAPDRSGNFFRVPKVIE
jgi:aspartyl-tRNA(Asn)/glutamyl-tRNA(Gln) amidotransferase subunit C